MSCNGCRVLRKGCSENCALRPCLQWIQGAEAQGHATVFVAKFFGRAGLMSFISAVPENQRPALFQSLLFEAAGRTVNPVNGAVGLLWTGKWHICQEAVESVLRGGTLRPIPELLGGPANPLDQDDASEACADIYKLQNSTWNLGPKHHQKGVRSDDPAEVQDLADLNLCLKPVFPMKASECSTEKRRSGTPSMNSEESVTTTCIDNGSGDQNKARIGEPKLLELFL